MKRIKLTQNKYALVDDEDFDYLNQWKWYYDNVGYAAKTKYIRKENGKDINEKILMHREVLKTPKGLLTDHINHNRLDNQKVNLRKVTKSQNMMNRGKTKLNTSGFKGVVWDKSRNRWTARITVNQKMINLGRFATLQTAWLARRWGERLHFKEYGYYN